MKILKSSYIYRKNCLTLQWFVQPFHYFPPTVYLAARNEENLDLDQLCHDANDDWYSVYCAAWLRLQIQQAKKIERETKGKRKNAHQVKDREDEWVEEEKGETQSWCCCHGYRRHLGEEWNRTALGKDPRSAVAHGTHRTIMSSFMFNLRRSIFGLQARLSMRIFLGYKYRLSSAWVILYWPLMFN